MYNETIAQTWQNILAIKPHIKSGKIHMSDAPIIQAAEAIETTIANPSPSNIVADIELAIDLVKQFKANIAGLHPSVINIIKALL